MYPLLRADHERGAVGADDAGQTVGVVARVEHGAREVVGRRSPRVRQHVAHVGVEAPVQRQLVEDHVVNATQAKSA